MNPQKRVMLIIPPRNILKSSVKRCCTPIGMAYIAAVLEQNDIAVKILDSYAEGYDQEKDIGNDYVRVGLDDMQIKNKISEFCPDYVGVTCGFTSEIGNTFSICKLAKEVNQNIQVVVGGLHPSNYPQQTMDDCKEIDYLILGEGEYRMLKLVQGNCKFDGLAIAKTNMIIPATSRIENLDELPFPARHLLDMEIYLKINKHISPYPKRQRTEQILTSRGCPGQCIFCTSSNFWGHAFRKRSPENVLKEMQLLIEKYGVQEFQFTDDSMTLDRERAIKIFEMMKPLNVSFCMANGVYVNTLTPELIKVMKEAGCYQITFSVESGSRNSLRLMKKNVAIESVKSLVKYAKKLGISCHSTFVLGIPGETISDIKTSFRYASDCDFDSASFFIVSPLPGSELYDLCLSRKYLTDMSFEKLDFKSTKINNPDLPPAMLERLVVDENTWFIIRYLFKHPIKFLKKYGMFMLKNPKEIPKVFGRVT
jgi:anaerobic magnesium-protoporphyrin IX monomethyl ester cyclase